MPIFWLEVEVRMDVTVKVNRRYVVVNCVSKTMTRWFPTGRDDGWRERKRCSVMEPGEQQMCWWRTQAEIVEEAGATVLESRCCWD